MKLLRSTKSNITKDWNAEKVPRLEITEVVLVNIILPTMIIRKILQ